MLLKLMKEINCWFGMAREGFKTSLTHSHTCVTLNLTHLNWTVLNKTHHLIDLCERDSQSLCLDPCIPAAFNAAGTAKNKQPILCNTAEAEPEWGKCGTSVSVCVARTLIWSAYFMEQTLALSSLCLSCSSMCLWQFIILHLSNAASHLVKQGCGVLSCPRLLLLCCCKMSWLLNATSCMIWV